MPKKKTERKTEFWWASIAGADPEPVEKTEVDGRPAVYTCGCADPFFLDDKKTLVRLLMTDWSNASTSRVVWKFADERRLAHTPYTGLDRPEHPDKVIAARAAQTHDSAPGFSSSHGWRGPR